ncbi:MAG TPA: NAD(P)/FAD-dependent oxidoreductase [Candidatus Sulfomarinibacteraceae bacterium]|nr:NAD(P)/FAD-dependent oxidoreductase [Candidatus Sulfomarinibacteraceae bacterium]
MHTFNTIVIGAGQAGLATGYHLAQQERDFILLDAGERVGDSWRNRWDSLELFTPAASNALPGMSFPAPDSHLPHKDEVADYLETYAARFDLPVRLETRVESVTRDHTTYRVETAGGQRFKAENVVVATGAFQAPNVPAFAGALDEAILQLHSSEYRNPDQLQDGPALVVGAANSGTQIALELAETRHVWLSGRDVGRVPHILPGHTILWLLWKMFLRVPLNSWLGSWIKANVDSGGDPVVGITQEEIQSADIERVPRTDGTRGGRPMLGDGRTLAAANVLWATGFVPDYTWIDLPIFREDGYPQHRRGVVEEEPGLYFVGLEHQHRLDSSHIGGVGDDAHYVVEHLVARTPTTERAVLKPAAPRYSTLHP